MKMRFNITPEDASKLTTIAIRSKSERKGYVIDYESPFASVIHRELVGEVTHDADAKKAADELISIVRSRPRSSGRQSTGSSTTTRKKAKRKK
jgi:hypothetical protein